MTRLTCNAESCVYNEGGFCGAEFIRVKGEAISSVDETECSNFELDTFVSEIKALVNTNFSDGIREIFSMDNEIKINPTVMCSVGTCFYNGEGKCEARDVLIYGENYSNDNKPHCQTFTSSY